MQSATPQEPQVEPEHLLAGLLADPTTTSAQHSVIEGDRSFKIIGADREVREDAGTGIQV